MVHTYNPRTQEAEAKKKKLNLRTAWVTEDSNLRTLTAKAAETGHCGKALAVQTKPPEFALQNPQKVGQ